jgi:hypothetical protein
MMASGENGVAEKLNPYLGFVRHGEAAARSDDCDFLLGLTAHGEDSIPVILRSRRGAGQHQGASTVLLGSEVELGQL